MTMLQTKTGIGILGCAGRVGTLLVQELESGAHPAALTGGTVRQGTAAKAGFYVTGNAADLFARADVLIDFTTPQATIHHAGLAAQSKKPLVIGTTGLSPGQEAAIAESARHVPILQAANMSVGVNLLLALVEQAAARLGPEWDIEIAETHHRHKVDAPSGTALALGGAAAAGRRAMQDQSPPSFTSPLGEGRGRVGGAESAPLLDRSGKRPPGSIGFSVQRGGDVVGEHTVTFFGEGERLELGHKATNRALFARGAIRAALWLKDQPAGLYSMRDVLGL